ncbi:hypothetical protein IPZ58_07595 [Streptomyces roseoverticillatus]|uniref:hypothetical protein n=1 Tax=Streptomyces roseoverticillatus TaxID=66429 RepID=UPI001F4046C6|nr:hypothetical protein [Streptomyces roseoverticillatus]MCF3101443.1 hypothetical protein [Streptomyces roseoverticillatus]
MERTHHTPHQPTQPAETPERDGGHPIIDRPATVEDCQRDYEDGSKQRASTFASWRNRR